MPFPVLPRLFPLHFSLRRNLREPPNRQGPSFQGLAATHSINKSNKSGYTQQQRNTTHQKNRRHSRITQEKNRRKTECRTAHEPYIKSESADKKSGTRRGTVASSGRVKLDGKKGVGEQRIGTETQPTSNFSPLILDDDVRFHPSESMAIRSNGDPRVDGLGSLASFDTFNRITYAVNKHDEIRHASTKKNGNQ